MMERLVAKDTSGVDIMGRVGETMDGYEKSCYTAKTV
jgi:hypothetical protein